MIELIGIAAGVLTTLCWLPQVLGILRSKSTKDISLIAQCAFTAGVFLWLVYGLALGRPALIFANGITFALAVAILFLKLRFG
jgi:MtN3 and saliva related transmembrane protein